MVGEHWENWECRRLRNPGGFTNKTRGITATFRWFSHIFGRLIIGDISWYIMINIPVTSQYVSILLVNNLLFCRNGSNVLRERYKAALVWYNSTSFTADGWWKMWKKLQLVTQKVNVLRNFSSGINNHPNSKFWALLSRNCLFFGLLECRKVQRHDFSTCFACCLNLGSTGEWFFSILTWVFKIWNPIPSHGMKV